MLDLQSDRGSRVPQHVDGLVVGDVGQGHFVDPDDGVADVEVVVVLVSTHFRHEDGEVVVGAAFDAEAQTAVGLSFQFHSSQLKYKIEQT